MKSLTNKHNVNCKFLIDAFYIVERVFFIPYLLIIKRGLYPTSTATIFQRRKILQNHMQPTFLIRMMSLYANSN